MSIRYKRLFPGESKLKVESANSYISLNNAGATVTLQNILYNEYSGTKQLERLRRELQGYWLL